MPTENYAFVIIGNLLCPYAAYQFGWFSSGIPKAGNDNVLLFVVDIIYHFE